MNEKQIQLQEVSLNVHNLANMQQFYQERIGLDVLSIEGESVLLGVAATQFPLVRLQPATSDSHDATYNGLYHLAIRVPSREALGNALYHWLLTKTPLIGASNHGYSEAIYLEDPEGNGIEMYRDLPQSEWDVRTDGRIVGITEEMDAQGVLAAATRRTLDEPFQLPAGTDMGHVHFSVANVARAKEIWMPVLQLDDKFSVPSGSWLAVGMYHHHFAFNQWAGTQLLKRSTGQLGLESATVAVDSVENYQAIKERAQQVQGMTVQEVNGKLLLTDEFGLQVVVHTLML